MRIVKHKEAVVHLLEDDQRALRAVVAGRAKIVSVLGARPQFIKAAAVGRALARECRLTETIIHTGQHFEAEMSSVFFRELDIPEPAYNLDIHSVCHGAMTGRMLELLESIFLEHKPDAILVYGDTNSTLAGALAGAKLNIPVGHVEAGLRSFNRRMPEELNRVLSDHASSVLFCPTSTAVLNLAREGITTGVETVGDVMYDVTLYAAARARQESKIVERLGLVDGAFAVATVHRPENTDGTRALAKVIDYLREHSRRQRIVCPLHPRTRAASERFGVSLDGLMVIPPCGYLDMHRLLQGAATVYTDSGGLQKEAYFHRVPCVTLRSETEWVETVEYGWNRLWQCPGYRARREICEYGDGDAGGKIVAQLVQWLGRPG